MPWQVIEVESRPPDKNDWVNVAHVLPLHGKQHELLGDECWCEPTIEACEDGFLVIHRDMN